MERDLGSQPSTEVMEIDVLPRVPLTLARSFLVFIAIPLILKNVPKNGYYGFRPPKTIAGSIEERYSINREGGIAIFIAGSISLLVSIFVPFSSTIRRRFTNLLAYSGCIHARRVWHRDRQAIGSEAFNAASTLAPGRRGIMPLASPGLPPAEIANRSLRYFRGASR